MTVTCGEEYTKHNPPSNEVKAKALSHVLLYFTGLEISVADPRVCLNFSFSDRSLVLGLHIATGEEVRAGRLLLI